MEQVGVELIAAGSPRAKGRGANDRHTAGSAGQGDETGKGHRHGASQRLPGQGLPAGVEPALHARGSAEGRSAQDQAQWNQRSVKLGSGTSDAERLDG